MEEVWEFFCELIINLVSWSNLLNKDCQASIFPFAQ